jgi:hypothetical protein
MGNRVAQVIPRRNVGTDITTPRHSTGNMESQVCTILIPVLQHLDIALVIWVVKFAHQDEILMLMLQHLDINAIVH